MYEQPRAKAHHQFPDSAYHFAVKTDYHQCRPRHEDLTVEISIDRYSQNHPSLPVLLWYREDGVARPWPLEVMRLVATESGQWFDQPVHLSFGIEQLPYPRLMPDGEPLTWERLHGLVEDRGCIKQALQEIYLARLAAEHLRAQFTWFPVTDAIPKPHHLLILTCDPPLAQKWSYTLRLPKELEKLLLPPH